MFHLKKQRKRKIPKFLKRKSEMKGTYGNGISNGQFYVPQTKQNSFYTKSGEKIRIIFPESIKEK